MWSNSLCRRARLTAYCSTADHQYHIVPPLNRSFLISSTGSLYVEYGKPLFDAQTYGYVLYEQVQRPKPYTILGGINSLPCFFQGYPHHEKLILSGAPTVKNVEDLVRDLWFSGILWAVVPSLLRFRATAFQRLGRIQQT